MSSDRGRWHFDGEVYMDYKERYPGMRDSLRIFLENLISSKMLLPTLLDHIPLKYDTLDELMDQIEATGYLEKTTEFDIWGDTVMYTSNGEEIYQNILCLQSFRTFHQSAVVVARTDHWLPMVMDREDYSFSWNLDLHRLNYRRMPALIKKLEESLQWKHEDLLRWDYGFAGWQGGYDFFLEDSIVRREYEENPNSEFDPEAYLAAIEKAKKQYKKY